ncbi:MAG: 5-formyltetrahydrofolate cyclo-ligase [Chitinophagaceae bacterium]|nr:MAG: 5-formyltetrahydrofolate cyclo-ligase [Chitinophagaceae bacterium]
MVKSAIRREYLQKRLDLDQDQVTELTARMEKIFESFPLKNIGILLSYYPLVARKEFDVSVCDAIVLRAFPRSKIGWPKTDPENNTMEAHLLQEHGLFAKNKFNILEPIGNNSVKPEEVDIVFVPLLACDQQGFRVGYGKGYYDRYLKRCRPEIPRVGFSFFEPLATIEDINQFDVPLSHCITPSRLYEF